MDDSIDFAALVHLPKAIFGRFWPPPLKVYLGSDCQKIEDMFTEFEQGFFRSILWDVLSIRSDDKWFLRVFVGQIICFSSILVFLVFFGTFFELSAAKKVKLCDYVCIYY